MVDPDQVFLVLSIKALHLRIEDGYQELEPGKALSLFDGLDRMARSDVRHFVAETRLSSFPLYRMDDQEVFALVRECIRDGRLVAVQKGSAKVQAPSAAAEQRHLVRAIEASTRGRLNHRGRRYKLVVDVGLAQVPGRDEYVVLSRDSAQQILTEMASDPSTPADLAPLLAQAHDKLTKDWRPPMRPDGLVMLLKDITPRTVSPIQEPAITPSQMKALLERTWYEILLVDEIGQPISGVELRLMIQGDSQIGKTGKDGRLRFENLPRGEAKAGFVDPPAVLALLSKRWSDDRPDD